MDTSKKNIKFKDFSDINVILQSKWEKVHVLNICVFDMEIYSSRKLQAYKSEILPRGKIFEYRMREYQLRKYQHIFKKMARLEISSDIGYIR